MSSLPFQKWVPRLLPLHVWFPHLLPLQEWVPRLIVLLPLQKWVLPAMVSASIVGGLLVSVLGTHRLFVVVVDFHHTEIRDFLTRGGGVQQSSVPVLSSQSFRPWSLGHECIGPENLPAPRSPTKLSVPFAISVLAGMVLDFGWGCAPVIL